MNRLQTRWRGAALIVAAFATTASAAEYSYDYWGTARPLDLDATSIAALDGAEHAVGHPISTERPVALDGWARFDLPDVPRDDAAVEALVAELAAKGDAAFVSPVFLDARGLPRIITPHLLIGVDPALAPTEVDALLAPYGTIEARHFAGLRNVYRVRSASRNGFTVLADANTLAAHPATTFAEPDMILQGEVQHIPNDPLFGGQWALNQGNDQDMDAPEAWDVETGDPGITVVILDLGIQQNHPDLNQLPGQDFAGSVPGGGPDNSCDNHGTAVAGCVSGTIDNSVGIVGVAPDCTVRSGKIGIATSFFGFCLGTFDSQPSMLANALNWSVTVGARATNSSFSYGQSATVDSAYQNSRNNGVNHFAATGNGGGSSISYPSSLNSIAAVGALQANGTRASFSQYGTGIAFSAPGADIDSTDRTGGAGYQDGDYVFGLDGTSFASPYAAGIAALILSVDDSLTPAEVEQLMRDTSVDLGAAGYDTTYGSGFLNAYNAVTGTAGDSCPADITGNDEVAFDDLVNLLSAWGPCPGCAADLDGNGAVDFADVVALLAAWGPCP